MGRRGTHIKFCWEILKENALGRLRRRLEYITKTGIAEMVWEGVDGGSSGSE
jgi:hypothetical protein